MNTWLAQTVHFAWSNSLRGKIRHSSEAQWVSRRQKANDMYYKFTAEQLVRWGCMFTDLFLGKPAGDFYIDDKGMDLNDFFSKRSY